MREIAAAGLAESAHDLSDGGLAVTAAECCVSIGAEIVFDSSFNSAERPEIVLFHEAPSRILISTGHPAEVEQIAAAHQVEVVRLGSTMKNRLRMSNGSVTLVDCDLEQLRHELSF